MSQIDWKKLEAEAKQLYTLILYTRDVQPFNIMGRIATWNISMGRRTY